jgi:long-chain fatty acid transport protein
MTSWWGVGILVSLGCLVPQGSYGQAFRYQPQSGTGAAQSNAFSAQADDASSVWYNPAGMTQLHGWQYSGTAEFVGASINFRNAAGATAHGDLGGTIALPPPSQFYLTANLTDLGMTAFGALSAGIGVTTPYALSTRYPDSGPFNTAVTSATIPMMDIKPTLAYRFNNHVSVGAGADIYTFANFVGNGQVEEKLVSPGGGGVPAGANVELNGKGTAPGFNVSLLFSPLLNADQQPIANMALVYRSQATMHLHGNMLVNGATVASTQSTLVLPQMFTAAMAMWPVRDKTREWKVEMDVDIIDWTSVRNLDVHLSNGGVIPEPQHWRTVPTISMGTEYKLLHPETLSHWDVAVRGGGTYTQSQVPDMTFNPGIPSLNSYTLATGIGATCYQGGKFFGVIPCGRASESSWMPVAIGMDASFQRWWYEPRTIQGNQNPTVDGTYKAALYLGALSIRLMF